MRILCYGDSNTWGYISGTDHQRYNESERWPKVLGKNLGPDFEVIEEGLNSRTLFTEDTRVGKEGRCGFTYLKPCLDSHDKIDVLVLMLGTNELKFNFKNSAEDILDMLKKYVKFISEYKSQIDGSTPKLIISGIPFVREFPVGEKYYGANKKSQEFCSLCEKYCKENNIIFVNNSDLETGVDGVHITLESHKILAKKLEEILKNL